MNEHEAIDQPAAPPDFRADIPAQLAATAYNGTSFSPERRGEQTRSDYAATLTEDYTTFRAQAEKGGTLDQLPEEFARYRAGLRKRWTAAVASDSRCVSWFIAGPSKFPAARMNKRADVAHRRWSEVFDFRARAKAAVIRNLRPDLAPIRSSDDDATERLATKIAQAEALQERMKAANAAIRTNRKAGADAQVAALVALGFSEAVSRKLLLPDFAGRIGFASYELTNNNAEIRRLRARLEHVATLQSTPETSFDGANARVDDCPSENRIRLTFPGKPSEAIRSELKRNGFRWTPSLGVWQAYRNSHTADVAKRIAG